MKQSESMKKLTTEQLYTMLEEIITEIDELSKQEKDYKKLIAKGFRTLKARQCSLEEEIYSREGIDYDTIIEYANNPNPHATNSKYNVWK
jgi:hypothetical protein